MKKAEKFQVKFIRKEEELQKIIEKNLDVFLGIRLLASEYQAGRGRIDTLGIDEKGNPVVIEYKKTFDETIIGQGRRYFTWLTDHKEGFELLVCDILGKNKARRITWDFPRLLCIAGDFKEEIKPKSDAERDALLVNGSRISIEPIRYRMYRDDVTLFEFLDTPTSVSNTSKVAKRNPILVPV